MFLKEVSGSSIKLVIIGKPIAVKYILERLTGVEPQDDYEEEIHIDEQTVTVIRKIKEKVQEINQEKAIVPQKMYVNRWAYLKG